MLLARGYNLVRLLEACGIWNDRGWDEWLGALSGGLHVPFEVGHLVRWATRPEVQVMGR